MTADNPLEGMPLRDQGARPIMQAAIEKQAAESSILQRRRLRQAKFFLVFAAMLFAGYATYTLLRYTAAGKLDALAPVVLVVLASALVSRWRAI